MYGEELEISRIAIYQVMDYYMQKYSLKQHIKTKFKLSNGFTYKIKFVYTEYFFLKYYCLFRKGNVGLNKDNCDYYVFVYPLNDRMLYRHDFGFYLMATDNLINMIIDKIYISDIKMFFSSKYKFSINDIFCNSKKLI